MDVGAELFEQIGCPIPSIGRFQNDFWMLAGLGHGLGQLERLARYSHTAEHLALGVHPIDRRGAAVQIDSDVLSLHRGLPCRGLVVRTPSIATLGSHGERRPRSFITSEPGRSAGGSSASAAARYRSGSGAPRTGPPRGPEGDSGPEEVLADRLGIDLELAADGGTRAPLGVEPDGPLGQIGPPDTPTPRNLVPLQEGEGRCSVDPVCLRQCRDGFSSQVPDNQLLDLLERKMALDLLLAKRARSSTPDAATGCLALLDQAFDGFPEAQIKQIGTKMRVPFCLFPGEEGFE